MSVGRPERAISSCSKQKEHATLPGVLSDHTRPSGLPASMAQNNSRRVWRGGARRAETAEIAAARSTPRPHPPPRRQKKTAYLCNLVNRRRLGFVDPSLREPRWFLPPTGGVKPEKEMCERRGVTGSRTTDASTVRGTNKNKTRRGRQKIIRRVTAAPRCADTSYSVHSDTNAKGLVYLRPDYGRHLGECGESNPGPPANKARHVTLTSERSPH